MNSAIGGRGQWTLSSPLDELELALKHYACAARVPLSLSLSQHSQRLSRLVSLTRQRQVVVREVLRVALEDDPGVGAREALGRLHSLLLLGRDPQLGLIGAIIIRVPFPNVP